MNFWQIFFRVVWCRPLPALGALWWQLTRRRVRARNRLRVAGAPLPFAYKFWMRNVEEPQQLAEIAASAPHTWTVHPAFTVVIDARKCGADELLRTIRSVEQQVFAAVAFSVIGARDLLAITLPAGTKTLPSVAAALAGAEGDFIVPLLGGEQLARWGLFRFAEGLQEHPDAAILYGDEDEVDAAGVRRRPWFKPEWNEELFLSRDYVSRACAIRTALAQNAATPGRADPENWVSDLLLRVIASDLRPVIHVPHIVAHVREIDRLQSVEGRLPAVREFIGGRGATAVAGPFGTIRVSWPLPDPLPLVSLIVPTRDKVELLRPCVESILAKTSYERFELIVVDNCSVEPDTIRFLEELAGDASVRVLSYPEEYNYSAINNFAARQARGSFLCLVNNDTEVVSPDWLTELMRYAVRSDIGAAGAKLLYADGSIQHAGVVIGIGEAAGHAHRYLPANDPGYFCHAHVAQFVSAVTGACLLVDKRKFLAVGGLDEELLPIAYNDVDLCLKLERAGWRNVYVPHAVLIHHESKSRAKDHAPSRIDSYRRELQTFQERWGAKDYKDPLLNPNLDRSSETFVIRF